MVDAYTKDLGACIHPQYEGLSGKTRITSMLIACFSVLRVLTTRLNAEINLFLFYFRHLPGSRKWKMDANRRE